MLTGKATKLDALASFLDDVVFKKISRAEEVVQRLRTLLESG